MRTRDYTDLVCSVLQDPRVGAALDWAKLALYRAADRVEALRVRTGNVVGPLAPAGMSAEDVRAEWDANMARKNRYRRSQPTAPLGLT